MSILIIAIACESVMEGRATNSFDPSSPISSGAERQEQDGSRLLARLHVRIGLAQALRQQQQARSPRRVVIRTRVHLALVLRRARAELAVADVVVMCADDQPLIRERPLPASTPPTFCVGSDCRSVSIAIDIVATGRFTVVISPLSARMRQDP